jgi:4-amino-4-deoxy-L-arabinose transferase-like glycosyltransferase
MKRSITVGNSKNLVVIIIVAFVLVGANIGGLYIYALDEAKNSTCAREMMEQGEWIVPTFNYELRTDKPPLHYYFMIGAYSIFGVNEFSARFFSVIMGILTVISIWFLAVRYYGHRTALYTSLVLLSSLHFALQFHMAVPDPYLIFFMTSGFVTFYIFYRDGKTLFLFLSYLSFGLGVLTKGPVAIALPGLAILLFMLSTRTFNWPYFLKLKPLWILAILVLIIAPWFIMVGIKTNGEWLNDFFFRHNLGRYTNTMEGHGAIFLVTPMIVILGLLPFSVFFIQAYRYAWKKRRSDDLLLFAGMITLTIITFFAFSSTKLPNYTVPAYPFVALLIGRYLDVLQDNFYKFRRSLSVSLWIYLIIAIILPVGLFIGLKFDPAISEYRSLSWYFLVIPVGALFAIILLYRSNYKGILLSLSLSWIISTLMFFYFIFPKIDKVNPIAKLLPGLDPEKPFVAYTLYNPAFSFYLKKPIPTFKSAEELNAYILQTGEGYILSRKSLENEFMNLENIYKIGEAKDIFEIPTTVVYEIKRKK